MGAGSGAGGEIEIELDVLIFGGGIAGLWLLDALRRGGYRVVLVEAGALGSGQTVASQGIIHGGLKYALSGVFNRSADAIKEMPGLWRGCLGGEVEPALTGTRVRADHCVLWNTKGLSSRLGMLGAASFLRSRPVRLERGDWPRALAGCGGRVYRVDEPVVDPVSLVGDLAARNGGLLLKVDGAAGLGFECDGPGGVTGVRVRRPGGGEGLCLRAGVCVFTAGAGNGWLRERVGLSGEAMQRRPLHMVVVAGGLPVLNGHCVDGRQTRVTVTSAVGDGGETVWQVGGRVAEAGVGMEAGELIAHTRGELCEVLGGVDFSGARWTTYRVDRAEAATGSGLRPETAQARLESRVVTAWPTKLALAPVLADNVKRLIEPPRQPGVGLEGPVLDRLAAWPRPSVAQPLWGPASSWIDDTSVGAV